MKERFPSGKTKINWKSEAGKASSWKDPSREAARRVKAHGTKGLLLSVISAVGREGGGFKDEDRRGAISKRGGAGDDEKTPPWCEERNANLRPKLKAGGGGQRESTGREARGGKGLFGARRNISKAEEMHQAGCETEKSRKSEFGGKKKALIRHPNYSLGLNISSTEIREGGKGGRREKGS